MYKKITINSIFKNYAIEFKNNIQFKQKKNCVYIIDKRFYTKNFNKLAFLKSKILLSANEKQKSFENLTIIIKKILKFSINRKTELICIGGGITQDIVSFLSSILLRGINWNFYPTTLLSQADSCIGGKTSINFLGTKNQIGNFYPPRKIIINVNFLDTLNQNQIISGIGEMAHYFLFASNEEYLFFKKKINTLLLRNNKDIKLCIQKCLIIKKKVIEKDELDTGYRLLLNYGHTFGHAIEKYSNYNIPHGIAVAIGMNISNYISYKLGFLEQKTFEDIHKNILFKVYKKIKFKNFDTKKFITFLKSDKKNTEKEIVCILTRGPGKMFIYKFKKNDPHIKNLLIEYFKK